MKKRLFKLFIPSLVIFCLVFSSVVSSSPIYVLEQSFHDAQNGNGGETLAQTFTANLSFKVAAIALDVTTGFATNTIYLGSTIVSGGLISTIYTDGTYSGSNSSQGYPIYALNTPVDLIVGASYSISMNETGNVWRYGSGNPYAGGNAFSVSAGVWVNSGAWVNYDFGFELFSDAAQCTVYTGAAEYDIDNDGEDLEGFVALIGNSTVTRTGFLVGTSPGVYSLNVSSAKNITTDGTYFVESLYGFNNGTTYYYKAQALNSEGWAYGAEESFVYTTVPSAAVNPISGLDTLLNGIGWGNTIGHMIAILLLMIIAAIIFMKDKLLRVLFPTVIAGAGMVTQWIPIGVSIIIVIICAALLWRSARTAISGNV